MATIQSATKYGDVRQAVKASQAVQTLGKTSGKAPNIFVPTLLNSPLMFEEWYWKGLREGGWAHEYLRREKALSAKRHRNVARQLHGKPQLNFKSDFKLKAAIPAREYFRWKAQDEHFWEDEGNLKRYRRDNPDAVIPK